MYKPSGVSAILERDYVIRIRLQWWTCSINFSSFPRHKAGKKFSTFTRGLVPFTHGKDRTKWKWTRTLCVAKSKLGNSRAGKELDSLLSTILRNWLKGPVGSGNLLLGVLSYDLRGPPSTVFSSYPSPILSRTPVLEYHWLSVSKYVSRSSHIVLQRALPSAIIMLDDSDMYAPFSEAMVTLAMERSSRIPKLMGNLVAQTKSLLYSTFTGVTGFGNILATREEQEQSAQERMTHSTFQDTDTSAFSHFAST